MLRSPEPTGGRPFAAVYSSSAANSASIWAWVISTPLGGPVVPEM